MENQGTKKIFLSYSQSTEKNEKLADDLEEMGHDIWLGQELSQGKWDENCRNIEDCELFIFALDKNSQHSEVCEIEWRYAAELESAILIVNVANDVSERILPAQLANFQTFDYCDYGIESFHDLKKLIGDIPLPGDLPNPLPNLPKAPMSYPNDMAPEKVGTAQNLSHESVKKIFLSYSARSEPAAMILREDIEHMNHEVTLVAVLDGGRAWWDEICSGIEECEVFILMLDNNWRMSESCKQQWHYVQKLGTPILPVKVGEVSVALLSPELVKYQQVNYVKRDKKSALSLSRNISELSLRESRAQAQRPPLPLLSPFQKLKNRIQKASRLRQNEQVKFVQELVTESTAEDENSQTLGLLRNLQQLSNIDAEASTLIDKAIHKLEEPHDDSDETLRYYLADYLEQAKPLVKLYLIVFGVTPLLFLIVVFSAGFGAVFGAQIFEDLLGLKGWYTTGGAVGGLIGFWLSVVGLLKLYELIFEG